MIPATRTAAGRPAPTLPEVGGSLLAFVEFDDGAAVVVVKVALHLSASTQQAASLAEVVVPASAVGLPWILPLGQETTLPPHFVVSSSQQEPRHAVADVKVHVGLPLFAFQPSGQVTAEHATTSLQHAAFLVVSVVPATAVLDSHAWPASHATGAVLAHVLSTQQAVFLAASSAAPLMSVS